MQRSLLATLAFSFLTLAALPAQTIDILGGTASAPTGANRAKASLYRFDTSVVMLDFEVWMDVPAADTLTFFAYRHHSRTGTATLEWTQSVPVAGGGGPQWHASGPLGINLVAGNHYALGVAWTNNLTYYYSTSSGPVTTSFGTWERAHTINSATPPATLNLPAGIDIAVYHHRLTSVPTTSVVNTGTPCSSTALLPRLVADDFFTIGSTSTLELVDTTPNGITLFGLAGGPAAATPLPLFGCSIWLDVAGPLVTLASLASPTGYSSLALTLPNDPLLSGLTYSAQGLVFSATSPAVDVSNAVSFTIN